MSCRHPLVSLGLPECKNSLCPREEGYDVQSRGAIGASALLLAMKSRETILWFVAAALVILGSARVRGVSLYDDSFQYLSEAQNLKDGNGLSTSIVHFDVERRSHRIPAPLTTFPPGYASAISLLSLLGLSLENAAFICSALSFVAIVGLIPQLGKCFNLNIAATRASVMIFLFNWWSITFGAAVLAESFFTFTLTAAILLFMWFESVNTDRERIYLIAGSTLVGAACFIRYAGYFLFAALALYYFSRFLLYWDRKSAWGVGGVALASLLILSLFLRNEILTGTWKGGNTKVVHNNVGAVVNLTLASFYHLFFSPIPLFLAGVLAVFLSFTAMVTVFGLSLINRGVFRVFPTVPPQVRLGVIVSAVYIAGIEYLAMTSDISFGSRMLFPILPLLIALLAWALQEVWKETQQKLALRKAYLLMLVLCFGTYLSLNSWGFTTPRTADSAQEIAALLDERVASGPRLRDWIAEHVPNDGVIVSTNGQATAYVCKRKTISLAGKQFSDQVWDEFALKSVMQSYDAQFLIVYSGDIDIDTVVSESPALQELMNGRAPRWLSLAAATKDTKVYRFVREGVS